MSTPVEPQSTSVPTLAMRVDAVEKKLAGVLQIDLLWVQKHWGWAILGGVVLGFAGGKLF